MIQADAVDATARVNGLRLHYREWGAADAPPLILLHGVTGHARSFDRFAAAMADCYRILALDQRGHGESDWAGVYSIEEMASDAGAFADSLGLERFALLGHSMGGRTAFCFAAEHPERIERLVIVDIGPNGAPSAPHRMDVAARIQEGVSATFATPEEAIERSRIQNPRPSEEDRRRNVLGNLVQRQDGRWAWRYDAAGLAARTAEQRAPSDERQWEIFPRIACPTLIVRGSESDQLTADVAERMRQVIPNARLVEAAHSGHSIPADNPDGFLGAVRPFLLAPTPGT